MSFIFLWVKKRLIYRQCFRPHFYQKNAMNNLETCHLGMKMKKKGTMANARANVMANLTFKLE